MYKDQIVYTLIGLITGLSIGLVGVGAGVLFIPFLVYYGLPIKMAITVGLALQLVPQSLPGFYLYYKEGHANWFVIFWCFIGSTIGIFIGSYLSTIGIISEIMIYKLLFIIMVATSIHIGHKVFGKEIILNDVSSSM